MHSESYRIIPDRHNFLSFLQTLELSPEQNACIRKIPLDYVEINERTNTWKISYGVETNPLEEQNLMAVAKKIAAACCVEEVSFINEKARDVYPPCEEDKPRDSVDVAFSLPEMPEMEIIPLPEEPPELLDENEEPMDAAAEMTFQSKAYQNALRALQQQGNQKSGGKDVVYGRKITKKPRTMDEIVEEENGVVVEGDVVGFEERELRTNAVILSILLRDETNGLLAKIRFGSFKEENDLVKNKKEAEALQKKIPKGSHVLIQGNVEVDRYENSELVMTIVKGIMLLPKKAREDKSEVKRIELHCHTKMSKMDGLTPIEELVDTAAKWGHKALAITDHGVVQAYPFAYDEAVKFKDFKLIFGVEGYLCHSKEDKKNYHIILLAKSFAGLRNLYRLVSLSHLQYFGGKPKRPRMTKGLIEQYRDDIIIGSACAAGEVYRAILSGASHEELLQIADFYDYLEIQPCGNNQYLLRDDRYPEINTWEDLQTINKKILALGDELGKLVVATCDVHFLNPEDAIARRILQAGMGYPDEEQPPLYLRTTEEMLEEFSYLGKERAYEVVVENTNKINDMIEKFKPVPDRDQLYSPMIPGAKEKVESMSYGRAHEWYGPKLPKIVEDRLKLELSSIIGNGFSVLYYIAHLLVKKSNDDGYMVGSRGSVGSSFVATMLNITEVNPLPPHYRCPHCYHTEWFTDGSVGSGFDLADKACPECGTMMVKDGHNIPFAVFLGFHGDKVPDIDLNFSGEYQPRAHKYTEDLFGRDNVFRAGTLGTIADKTAYGYIKKYYENRNEPKRTAFIEGLIPKLVGVKRTTGQHPAGIMVVPRDLDVHYLTPVSYPADDPTCGTITTHYDYHSINDRIVKLDILGHDDPTMIRMLEDITHLDAQTIPLDNPEVMSLFKSTEALGIKPEDIGGCPLGCLGVPEFGTDFVIQMLLDTKPQSFSDLIRISGLSHGTDVWLGNAQTLIEEGKATISTAICTRDDIMIYLIDKGLESELSFTIMESVRKGKGLKPEWEEEMKAHDVPDWYIWSCKKIKYMFPKAHAAAYVMMAYRIAYYKIFYPLAYYAAYFSIRASAFSYELMCMGRDRLEYYMKDYEKRKDTLTQKEQATVKDMKIVQEMYARGFDFVPVDLYKAQAHRFQVYDDKHLMPALDSIEGLGDKAADAVVLAARNGKFLSKDDFRDRTKVSKTIIDFMADLGVFGDLPESNQFSLFDY